MLFYLGVMHMILYDRIRELRKEAGITQEKLAHAMNYKDRSMITKIESGKVDISQKKIDEFAKVLNTTPAYLMGWTDNPAPDIVLERVIPIIIPDSERFVKLVSYMPTEDYRMVMEAFSRAEERMKEEEGGTE